MSKKIYIKKKIKIIPSTLRRAQRAPQACEGMEGPRNPPGGLKATSPPQELEVGHCIFYYLIQSYYFFSVFILLLVQGVGGAAMGGIGGPPIKKIGVKKNCVRGRGQRRGGV